MPLGLGLGLGLQFGGLALDPSAAALIAAMTTPPSAGRAALINAAIVGLKSDGVWPLLDVLYLPAAADSQAGNLNWTAPASFALTGVGGGATHVADRGYTGDGLATAMSTNYTPSTDAVQFTQNNASMWVWSVTDVAENAADCGAAVTHNSFIRARSPGNAISANLNSATTVTAAIGTAVGLTGISRLDASNVSLWKNGVQQGSAIAAVSSGLPTAALRICGRTTDLFSTKQIAMFAAGADLGGRESSFFSRIQAYLQGVGAA